MKKLCIAITTILVVGLVSSVKVATTEQGCLISVGKLGGYYIEYPTQK